MPLNGAQKPRAKLACQRSTAQVLAATARQLPEPAPDEEPQWPTATEGTRGRDLAHSPASPSERLEDMMTRFY